MMCQHINIDKERPDCRFGCHRSALVFATVAAHLAKQQAKLRFIELM